MEDNRSFISVGCWSPWRLHNTRIVLNGQEVPWCSEVKYLGVTLDKRLTFASHTTKYLQLVKKSFTADYHDRMDAARKLEWSMVILKDLESYEPKIKKLSALDSSSTVPKSLKAILLHRGV
jgi:hypothetical protein